MKFPEGMPTLGGGSGRWKKILDALSSRHLPDIHQPITPLRELHDFGSNPGNLRMFGYRPPMCSSTPALVVVLHGCTQSAAGYDLGAGWSTTAARYGFALLMPEQQRSNNPNGCFNWFQPEDSKRGRGEALSIKQMIERYVADHHIDPSRIFITGLSAGGAMTSVMLACYPELFAGGAIVAGLPYGAATNVKQAFESMYQSPSRSPREWGDLVRQASAHKGPWPRISIWHGSADKTVIPRNAREILKQWTELHGLPFTPSSQTTVDGYPREVWTNKSGEDLIESYAITNMAHGTPLAVGDDEGSCGAAGPFLLPVGISSSYHIAKFFGIATGHVRDNAAASSETGQLIHAPTPPERRAMLEGEAIEGRVLHGEVLHGEVLHDEVAKPHKSGSAPAFSEIGEVINKALRAAGLLKG
jgi:poly(hydroxyalkanoate) depolymerase family esterase